MAQPSNPFIRQLASSDRKSRTTALASLRTYLSVRRSRNNELSPLDLQKLWKALFYCLWMQDKPLHQQNLSRDLAGLVDILPQARQRGGAEEAETGDNQDENEAEEEAEEDTLVVKWFDCFWLTISREWSAIDALRMDKFLYLVRCYLNTTFQQCSQSHWNPTTTRQLMFTLARGPLSPANVKVPDGLRYHIIDIFVDELEKVDVKRECDVEVVLEPLRVLRSETRNKQARKRAVEALRDERLEEWGVVIQKETNEKGEDGDRDAVMDDDEFGGFDD
ncbi:hypothetical protein LTR62_002044 [Meristemomyces frigidus]|uniref:Ribosomal RNA-processing protein 1 n=1 Tax=Meristemomyces frigidus TaxID=1508187 RepID=A0AAN7TRX4_9PEZI|nr:hypothetical protein LTR62_002044 [Meristemomyces frigidus]